MVGLPLALSLGTPCATGIHLEGGPIICVIKFAKKDNITYPGKVAMAGSKGFSGLRMVRQIVMAAACKARNEPTNETALTPSACAIVICRAMIDSTVKAKPHIPAISPRSIKSPPEKTINMSSAANFLF